ncbi:Oligopeptide-binding protein AppA [Rubrobacter xylanophilus DSM 9941]|uniref:peptide ABC transporter substrate-binding protein n=1 Tax=Rubrobacter xylanophilus TaxID=49319 RepID=UPI001C63FFD8|nr:peptide ABC transporter substrate-binding protein [Rubrobacter xylanophilus]QYJ17074.1 Oligopeptide-binding protein AppA [Rubrobacter xylanophilus DSM 9941]
MSRESTRAGVALTGVSRRDFLRLSGAGLAGAALLGVAGCGGEQGGGQQGGGGGGGGRNELIVGLDQEPAILNGFIVGGDLVATSNVTRPIMESVLQIMPDLSYAPKLADGEPQVVSEDPLTIEFRLKDGITWSDGEPLTVEDYVFTYETVMNDRWQIITREIWDSIDRIETPDELTARIIFREPDARWRDILAADVLPRHILQGKNFNKYFNDRIVGSGPYVFEEWRKGQSLTVVANENYWGDPPAIKRITFRFIPDTNSLKAALRSGEVQFINPPPDIGLIEELRGYDGVTVQTKFGTVWEHLAFNVEKVDNLNIRRAIAYAVNRRQLIEEILQGDARPLQSVLVPEQEPFYTPAWERYSFDPDQARQLVERARGEGASTEIEYSTTSGNALRETAQQVIQQQMEQVGITLRINNSSAETFFGERTPEGDFELGEWAWSATPDPSITTLFGANQVPPDGQNYYRYRNQEVTRLLEQADVTVDQQERARLTRQAQELMAEDVPLVPLYQRPEIYAYADNLEGPEVNPTLATAFWNVGEWRFTG